MKFYELGDDIWDLQADPCKINIANILCTYQDNDAFPYVVTNERVIFGNYGEEHDSVLKRLGKDEISLLEGRLWTSKLIISNWDYNDHNSNPENMKRLSDAFRGRLSLSPDKITYCEEFSYEHEFFIVIMSLNEYLSLNVVGNIAEFFWRLKNKQNKHTDVKPAFNGMDTKDIWRHYEMVGESKMKLNESQLRQVIKEIINRLIM